MIKYFCDICGKEVPTEYRLKTISLVTEGEHVYHACETCRNNILKCINKLQEESKNGNT